LAPGLLHQLFRLLYNCSELSAGRAVHQPDYGESAFSTFTVGAKFRFTGPNNPYGIGLIPFYRFYADRAGSSTGFNQLQRGASPGGGGPNPFGDNGRGDFGLVALAMRDSQNG
jgi:hypothetical protein